MKQTKKSVQKTSHDRNWRARQIFRWLIIPALVYLGIFYLTQPHYITEFSKQFYIDVGDGYQNVWNIWWVHEAIVDQVANPYWTNFLQWPHGTTLIPQTMNIINGLAGIPLIEVFRLSLVQTVNIVVLATFVFGGVTMFWFIQKLYNAYYVSLIAGGLFTFSSYHFAHAQGHLQLITLQYIPLFLLAFWRLVEKPRYRYAIAAALSLVLVMMSDYYYLVWCVMLGGMWGLWNLYKKQLLITRHNIKVFSLFLVLCLGFMGPLIFKLSQLSKEGVLLGSHDPVAFSLDPFALFIPGGSWVLRSLTDWHWQRLPYFSEMSVYFGWGLIVLVLFGFYKTVIRRNEKPKAPSWMPFWWIVMGIFGILALGPHPHVYGRRLLSVDLPYAWLEKVWPTLKVSGMPVRWAFISLIAAIVIGAYVLTLINIKQRRGQILLGLFLIVSFVELWPARLPLSPGVVRPYVKELKKMPQGAVIDNAAVTSGEQLFSQTYHEKPIAFGYVTRIPKDVDEKNFLIFAALEEGRHSELCEVYKIRYTTVPKSRPLVTKFPIIYTDSEALIYDMKNSPNC